jgi:hypothetical protein
MAKSKAANVTAVPITAATIAVTGNPSGVCTAANVTTAVIVPGPAANMIGGASDFCMLAPPQSNLVQKIVFVRRDVQI